MIYVKKKGQDYPRLRLDEYTSGSLSTGKGFYSSIPLETKLEQTQEAFGRLLGYLFQEGIINSEIIMEILGETDGADEVVNED